MIDRGDRPRDRSPSRANASPTYLDVRVRRHALLLRRRLHFLDLHRGRQPGGVARSAAHDDPAPRKRRVEETRSLTSAKRRFRLRLNEERQTFDRLLVCDSSFFRRPVAFYLVRLNRRGGARAPRPRALRTARPSAFRRSRVPPTHGKGRRRTSLRPETANALAPRTIVEMPAACVAPAAALGAAAASRRQGSPLRARAAAKQGAISLATTPRLRVRDAREGFRARRRPSPRAEARAPRGSAPPIASCPVSRLALKKRTAEN